MPKPVEGPIIEITTKETDPGISRLWNHFGEITQISRKTGQEDAIAAHVVDWAMKKCFDLEVDSRGNLLVLVPATEGLDQTPGVILQGHLDMVCVGEPDPATNPVSLVLSSDGQWLKAKGTTLGADNGIGMATAMAMAEENMPHGPLAIMLTRNEEVMMDGAMDMGFKNTLTKYKYLFNLDSEDAGEATISCAGGGDTLIDLPIQRETLKDQSLVTLSLENLLGGHSGISIHEGRLNGIQVMGQVLNVLTEQLSNVKIAGIKAGVARNAIPKDVSVTIAVNHNEMAQVAGIVNEVTKQITKSVNNTQEKAMSILLSEPELKPKTVLDEDSTMAVIRLFNTLPHGVEVWSESVPGLVQTSTNLAIAKLNNNAVRLEMMTRSSQDNEVEGLRGLIQQIAEAEGAKVEQLRPYPGWPAKPESPINQIANQAWKEITGKDLKIIAIHAGLECGVIIGKYPHLEAISIGPTITGAHSTEEQVNIETVSQFYALVKNLISRSASA